jgi:hypothetical protein
MNCDCFHKHRQMVCSLKRVDEMHISCETKIEYYLTVNQKESPLEALICLRHNLVGGPV